MRKQLYLSVIEKLKEIKDMKGDSQFHHLTYGMNRWFSSSRKKRLNFPLLLLNFCLSGGNN